MLRLGLVVLLATCFVNAEDEPPKIATREDLLKQKQVFNLLYHISQPTLLKEPLYEQGAVWDIEANIDAYTNTAAVKEFLYTYENGMLPRGDVFSIYYPKLLAEMKALFKLFYYAKDFDTFYKTALWARMNVNEAQFLFATYNAVIRRPDTKYIQLPALYEMYPHLYFNAEVLQKAHQAKLFGKMAPKQDGTFETYIIPANYSGWYLTREFDMENKLNYFMEDIGLNTYYFFLRQDLPFWLESDKFDLLSYRGGEYLYAHKLLLDRYNLERLSNDLPRIEDFSWNREFPAGYYPAMTFHNGLPLPQRPLWSRFPFFKQKYIQDIQHLESRIAAAIDSGRVLTSEGKTIKIYEDPAGLNILGNLIEGNMDSANPEFYGSIDNMGRKILGFNLDPVQSHQVLPSALETHSSSMRDPAFYRLYNKILSYYYRYNAHQKPYTKDEIIHPSLKIEYCTVDKLNTYFDQFDASINNGLAVRDAQEAETILIKVRQYRLNHKPFNFHIAINADKPTKAAIRIFLGPKYDSRHKLMEIPESLKYFYEIDNWILELKQGLNKIKRKSDELLFIAPDQEPSEVFYKKLLKSLDGSEQLTLRDKVYGFPERLLLPKGKKEGMPFQLFIYVSPISSEAQYVSRTWGEHTFDNNTYGFPIDKLLPNYKYDGPNMLWKDILIYHKDEIDVNIPY